MNNKIPIDKKGRFKRLATSRTTDVLKRLQVLSNCANRSAYEYSEEEINKIFSTIEKSVRDAKSKFYYPKEKIIFKL
ncbi:MAG: hypothetical protein PHG23_01485 [Candidatus Pacebacteria bacterium]|nr:hypothetical protein [Candidatus Paceibacterota bacterium]